MVEGELECNDVLRRFKIVVQLVCISHLSRFQVIPAERNVKRTDNKLRAIFTKLQ